MVPYFRNSLMVQFVTARLKHFKSFTDCLHHSIFYTVMNHFHIMSASALTTMEVAIFKTNTLKKWFAMREHFFLASDHCTDAFKCTTDATACSAIKIFYSRCSKVCGT